MLNLAYLDRVASYFISRCDGKLDRYLVSFSERQGEATEATEDMILCILQRESPTRFLMYFFCICSIWAPDSLPASFSKMSLNSQSYYRRQKKCRVTKKCRRGKTAITFFL